MINEVKAYTAECDGCGTQFEDGFQGFSIFSDEQYLGNALDTAEWYRTDGEVTKCYCPSCHSFNDEDELVLKNKL